MKSIIQTQKICYLCGSTVSLEKHHIFGGGNRKKSEADGLTVWLCSDCHRNGRNAAHRSSETALKLHKIGQAYWEVSHGLGHEDFIARYGRNYL